MRLHVLLDTYEFLGCVQSVLFIYSASQNPSHALSQAHSP